MALSREQILSNKAKRVEKIAVPEWGGDVFIREISAAERDAYEAAALDKKGNVQLVNVRARLVALTLCDEAGVRMFTDLDHKLIADMPAAGVDRVFAAASKLNAFSKEDIEELEKNSETAPPAI